MNIRSEGCRNSVSDVTQPPQCSSNLEQSHTRVLARGIDVMRCLISCLFVGFMARQTATVDNVQVRCLRCYRTLVCNLWEKFPSGLSAYTGIQGMMTEII